MKSFVSVLSRSPNLVQELKKVLPSVNFVEIKNPGDDSRFKESTVIVGDYPLVGPYLYSLPNLKWLQGTWAGVESLMPHIKPEQFPNFPITRFSGYYFGQLMGEYVLTNIVNNERNFFQCNEKQKESEWFRKGKILNYRSIFDLSVGIFGLGTIGNRIGKILHFMGAEVHAFGRRAKVSDYPDTEYVSKYFTKDTLPAFLSNCDYIVNVLPTTPETAGLLNGNVLENCKDKQTVFINIGRGTIISEQCLLNALNNGWISGAILDVFEKEPLSKESALWKHPSVFITPHVSGNSRSKDVAMQFKENYQLFEKNLPLPNAVDFVKGY